MNRCLPRPFRLFLFLVLVIIVSHHTVQAAGIDADCRPFIPAFTLRIADRLIFTSSWYEWGASKVID